MTHDISKLPGWARDLIRSQDERITRLLATVEKLEAKLESSYPESDTFADPRDEHPVPLGKSTRVRFGGFDTLGTTYDVHLTERGLSVRANDTSTEIAVLATSSNHFLIRNLPR